MSPELVSYKANGFFVAKGLLEEKSVQRLMQSMQKTVTDQLRALSASAEEDGLFPALKALHRIDIQRYKKVVGALWRKEEAFKLAHDKNITDFLREKFGWHDIFLPGGQVALIMSDELKIPNGYFGFVTHQDFPSVQGSLDGVVVWFPLVNVDRSNFPLEVIPQSHRLGLLPTIKHGESTWEVNPDAYNQEEFVPIEVDVGDVIFMSVFTIHRSSINGAPGRFRLAMSTRFDNGDEPTFVDRVYPTAYTRSVQREQYFEGFPTPAQVKAVFGS
ncbi:phytanoyl-CoA dioxygenase family protein [Afipia massiliensis]|uniref:Phytanoyl-CoA dioxygenase family protein n=1 Tax=Afipia massiliensis TaxID=211460 RepID=A0A4U6BQR4_9BRAD|nr:phytanoyl-CoA dioxygenase family protein [Afipia massiliensis]TKT72900.1 phytanoyl-CoA dioxygenase family protein [Afipia massiliensis]